MESMDTELTTYRVAYASGGIRRGGVPVPRISCSTRYGEYRCAVSFPTSQCWYDVACQTQTLGKQDAPHITPGISGLQGRFSTTHTHTYNKHLLRLAQRRYVIEIPHSFLFSFLSFSHHTRLYSPFGLSLYPSIAYHIISSHLSCSLSFLTSPSKEGTSGVVERWVWGTCGWCLSLFFCWYFSCEWGSGVGGGKR